MSWMVSASFKQVFKCLLTEKEWKRCDLVNAFASRNTVWELEVWKAVIGDLRVFGTACFLMFFAQIELLTHPTAAQQ